MAWIAEDPHSLDGQEVDLIKESAKLPDDISQLHQGAAVRDNDLPYGTVIATFDSDGHCSRAAVFIRQEINGILVWDRFPGQPVQQRMLNFRGGTGATNDDGDQYYVVEDKPPQPLPQGAGVTPQPESYHQVKEDDS